MTDTAALVTRVQTLKTTVANGRDRRVRAEAAREQAEQNLAALLAEHGCQSIEELAQKAADATQAAVEMLSAAERAVGLS